MASLRGFDAGRVEPLKPLEPLPAGAYRAAVTRSELKPNKARTGRYLGLTFQVTDGPHRGRLVRARLNLVHPNPTAVRLAQAELSAVGRAVGVKTPQDSSELHGRPLVIHVRVVKRSDTGEPANDIADYAPPPAAAPASGSPPDPRPEFPEEEIPW